MIHSSSALVYPSELLIAVTNADGMDFKYHFSKENSPSLRMKMVDRREYEEVYSDAYWSGPVRSFPRSRVISFDVHY